MSLPDEPETIPSLRAAASSKLATKSVYVLDKVGGKLKPRFDDGEKAVVEQGAVKAELKTRTGMGGNPSGPATYLNDEDLAAFATAAGDVTIRAYGWGDTWAKIKSPAGFRLGLTMLVALLTFASGAWFQFEGSKGTDAATVAERGERLLDWAQQPAERLEGANAAAVRGQLADRRRAAASCLAKLRGPDVPEPDVNKVAECKPAKPSPLKDKDNAPVVAIVLGLVTLGLTLWTSNAKFGFGKDPADA